MINFLKRSLHFNLILISFLFFLFEKTTQAQNKISDSLLIIIKKNNNDSNEVKALNSIAAFYFLSAPDSAMSYSKRALDLSNSIRFEKGRAEALGGEARYFWMKGDYNLALEKLESKLELYEKMSDQIGICGTLGNIGTIFYNQGNYSQALVNYYKALEMAESLKDTSKISVDIGNIGMVYNSQTDYGKALTYYFKALKIDQARNNREGIARHFGNIGLNYFNQKKYSLALEFYFKAFKEDEALGNRSGIARHLGNIGIVYKMQADKILESKRNGSDTLFGRALGYYFKALHIVKEVGDKNGEARHLGNIGSLYISLRKFPEAIKYTTEAVELAREIHVLDEERDYEFNLNDIYSKSNDYQKALIHYKKFVMIRDSITNAESTKKTVQTQMQYDFDKKQTADSIRNAELVKQEQLKHGQEIKQQKLFTYGGIIGFILMMVVALVSLRAYRQKQNANQIISLQKQLVEEKQKEILDSIHYAKRIQNSLLPTGRYIERNLDRLRKNK